MKQKRSFVILICICVLALCLRTFALDRFPVGLWHDEAEYVLSARTIGVFGEDVSGVKIPRSFMYTTTEGRIAELPAIYLAPFYYFFPLNQLTARLPFALISVLTGIILYLLVYTLLRNKSIALLTLFVYSINPWAIFFGRTGSDAFLALFFYLTGIYFLLKEEGSKIWYSAPFFLLGFFSYHGTKYILLPLLLVTLLFRVKSGTKSKDKPLTLFGYFSFFLLIVLGYYLLILKLPGTPVSLRREHTIPFDLSLIYQKVDVERRLSVQQPINYYFINKGTSLMKFLSERVLSFISLTLLFISGDERAVYKFYAHGLFYYIDIIYLVFGSAVLFKISKKKFIYLLSLGLIATIPTLISLIELSHVLRSSIVFSIFIIIIAAGMWWINTSFFVNKTCKLLINILTSFITVGFLAVFLHFYYFRLPIISPESFFLSERIQAKYLNLQLSVNPEKKIWVTCDVPYTNFLIFAYYNNLYNNKDEIKIVHSNVKNQNYSWKNLIITDKCPEKEEVEENKKTLFITNVSRACPYINNNSHAIVSLNSAGQIFRIFNDEICSNSYKKYLTISDFRSFNIDSMDQKLFCETWIARPD